MSKAKILVGVAVSLALIGVAQAIELAKVSPSVAQVVKMHESNVATDVLLAYVKETPIPKPNAEEVLYLSEKGVGKDVIVAMLSKRVWAEAPAPGATPPQTQTQLPPAVTPAQPAPQTVVVQQPAPTVTYVTPPPVYYAPRYYDPWPRLSIGIGLGHFWHHGPHWGHYWHGHRHHWHHGHGGLHVHRR